MEEAKRGRRENRETWWWNEEVQSAPLEKRVALKKWQRVRGTKKWSTPDQRTEQRRQLAVQGMQHGEISIRN